MNFSIKLALVENIKFYFEAYCFEFRFNVEINLCHDNHNSSINVGQILKIFDHVYIIYSLVRLNFLKRILKFNYKLILSTTYNQG